MSQYDTGELLQRWIKATVTPEQAIGQLIQKIQELERRADELERHVEGLERGVPVELPRPQRAGALTA